MEAVYKFFGKFLAGIYTDCPQSVLAVSLTACLIRLALCPVLHRYIKSVKLSEVLKPRIDAINTQYSRNPKLANEKSMDLMNSVHYPYFGSIWNFVVELLISWSLTQTTAHPMQYVDRFLSDGVIFKTESFLIKDFNLSAYSVLKNFSFGKSGVFYVSWPVAAVMSKFFIDKHLRAHTLVERETLDSFMLIIVAVLSFLLPQTFSLIWVILEFVNLLHLLYVYKFVSVKLVEQSVKANKAIAGFDK